MKFILKLLGLDRETPQRIDGTPSLTHLQKLTDNLRPLSSLVMEMYENRVAYDTHDTGECTGNAIYNDGNIAIQKTFISKGAILPSHCHVDCMETLIMISGHLKIINGAGEEVHLKGIIGERMYCFGSGEVHEIEAIEDTVLIGITIPADKGYPRYG
jgi:quercetin dioxygenase-like cupin family protein